MPRRFTNAEYNGDGGEDCQKEQETAEDIRMKQRSCFPAPEGIW